MCLHSANAGPHGHFRSEKASLELYADACGDYGPEAGPGRCDVSGATYAQRLRRMCSKPCRARGAGAEAGLCHTVLSLCSPISSFLAQNGPAIFISLWA